MPSPERLTPNPFRRLATWLGVPVIALGWMGLISWYLDLPLLSSVYSTWIPMAPGTAATFIFLGIILLLAVNGFLQGGRLVPAVFVVALVSILGLLPLVDYLLGNGIAWESKLFPRTGKLGHYLTNRMSPITGVLFFLSGAALQIILVPALAKRGRKWGELLAVVVAVAGFAGTLGYLLGSPLLYGGDIIPVACTTTVAFLFLGCALLAAAGPESLILGALVGPSVRARLLRVFLPIVTGLVLLQAVMNYLLPDFFKNYPGLSASLWAIGFLLITSVVVAIVGRVIGQDIDRSEQELFQAKEELERTFEAIPDLIAVLDTEYRIVKANKAMKARLGPEGDGAIGRKCYECVHDTKSPPESCPHQRLLADGRAHIQEVHEERLGGDFIVTVAPLHDSKGEIVGSVHVAHDITERKRTELERDRLISELQEALAQIKTLRGFIPICAYCKNIRDDAGYWQQLEKYLREHSDAEFSHGICPDCLGKLKPALADEKTEPAVREPGIGLVHGQGKILVLDDEDSVRGVVSKILELIGYEAVGAKNGEEALDLYHQAQEAGRPFTAVILDLSIPGNMGGKKVLEQLLVSNPHIKAIASTGYADDPIVAHFEKYGFKALIAKPFNMSTLGKVLDQVMNE
ncbi:MAG: response regulator [Deltaproteobacteria bacterium]|nr:MAG: response regulator [Deltaproteobacteria bacterium]